jgi:hypothetical protein
MFMHRSAAPRMPPTTSNRRRVRTGGASGSAASRRLSVIAGASTILPGFIRPSGSKIPLTVRMASYNSSPKISRLNSLRASPSPCSLELTPPYSRTRFLISSATPRIARTCSGRRTSTNGRMCRQPTEQCP